MYTSTKESLQLMRKIMDVQEDLEKLRSESVSRHENSKKTRSFSKDSKVSPRTHKLSDSKRLKSKDPIKFHIPTDEDQENIEIEHVSKKDKLKKQLNMLQFPHNESTSELDSRDHPSKKPPTNPSRITQNGFRDITTQIVNEIKPRTQKQEKVKVILDSPQSQSNFNPALLGLSGKISPRVSPYNKEKTTKTHLLVRNSQQNDENTAPTHIHQLTKHHSHHVNLPKQIDQNPQNDENFNIEYHTKEPILTHTYKDSQKKASRTNTLRSSHSHTSTRLTPPEHSDPIDSTQVSTQLEIPHKKKLEFDEDRPLVREIIEKKPRNYSRPESVGHLRPNTQENFGVTNSTVTSNRPFFRTQEDQNSMLTTQSGNYISTEPGSGTQFYNFVQNNDSGRMTSQVNTSINSINSSQRAELGLDLNDKNKVLSLVLDLKNKVQARELEILELKNGRMKYDSENQNLLHQIKELLSNNKTNEGNIEKLKQQVGCQEKEIEFLKRLETNLHDAGSLMEAKENKLIKQLQTTVEEKSSQIKELNTQVETLKLQVNTAADEERSKYLSELTKLKIELKNKEDENNKLKLDFIVMDKKTEEYGQIDKKILELEEMQEKLIEENNTLKSKLSTQSKPIKENDDLSVFLHGKDIGAQMFLTSKKLKEIEEYSRRLIKILQAAIAGDEPPIELILKHNRAIREKSQLQHESDLKAMTLKQLSQQNMLIIENLHNSFIVCMDQICDSYAVKYGNECNVQ